MTIYPLCAQLKQFLTYFEQTTESNVCNEDLAELHKMVSWVKMDEEVELEYMKIHEREEMIREEGVEQGINQGIVRGQSEGSILQLLRQVTKKIAKEKSPEVIAEELEEDAVTIALLYDLIQKNPGRTAEELLPYIDPLTFQP